MHDPGVRTDTFVSVVAVVDDRPIDLTAFVNEVHTELRERYTNYEFLLVDNGLAQEELITLRDLLAQLPCIRVLRLARRFPVDTAIFAGLESAIGDFVVVLDPQTDPASTVPEIVELNRAGHDIVQGLAKPAGRWHGGAGRSLFFAYNRRYLGVDIPKNATNLTGLSRRAVNSLTNTSRHQKYLRHFIRHVGYRIADYPYERKLSPRRQRGLWIGLRDGIEMVSSYSTHPLQAVAILGVAAALLNLLYAGYIVVVNVVSRKIAEGWTSTSMQLSIMFFLICIILAVLSEYVGRILVESRDEPSYFILEELESDTLIADMERRNVSS